KNFSMRSAATKPRSASPPQIRTSMVGLGRFPARGGGWSADGLRAPSFPSPCLRERVGVTGLSTGAPCGGRGCLSASSPHEEAHTRRKWAKNRSYPPRQTGRGGGRLPQTAAILFKQKEPPPPGARGVCPPATGRTKKLSGGRPPYCAAIPAVLANPRFYWAAP